MTVKNVPKLEYIGLCAAFKYTKSFTCESRAMEERDYVSRFPRV